MESLVGFVCYHLSKLPSEVKRMTLPELDDLATEISKHARGD